MTHNPKILRRVRNLVELAASTHSANERASASVEAVRLIAAHQITLALPHEDASLPPLRGLARAVVPRMTFERALARQPGRCAYCGTLYRDGDEVFVSPGGVVLHAGWPDACDEACT